MSKSGLVAAGLCVVLVACGGGSEAPDAGGGGADAMRSPDAALPDAALPDAALPDAGPPDAAPAICAMGPSYDTLNLGNAGTPVPLSPGAGTGVDANGNRYTAIFGNLSVLEPDLPNHGITLFMTDALGMFATGGALGPWSGPPTLATPASLDPFETCGGCLIAYGGMPLPGPPSDTNLATQVYVTDSGTLTMNAFSPPPAEGVHSNVFGSYNAVTMTGYDAVTGEPLVPPCTVTLTQLNFFYDVLWGPPTP